MTARSCSASPALSIFANRHNCAYLSAVHRSLLLEKQTAVMALALCLADKKTQPMSVTA